MELIQLKQFHVAKRIKHIDSMEFGMYGMFEMEYVSNEYQIEYRNGARRSFKLADHRTVINPT